MTARVTFIDSIFRGKEIVAQLPNDIDCFGVHGNALYFESLSKVRWPFFFHVTIP